MQFWEYLGVKNFENFPCGDSLSRVVNEMFIKTPYSKKTKKCLVASLNTEFFKYLHNNFNDFTQASAGGEIML